MASQDAILRAIDHVTAEVVPVPRAERRMRGPGRPETLGVKTVRRMRGVLDKKNSVGVGMGYRIKGGKPTKELCLQVYVVKKVDDESRLKAEELVPETVITKRGEAVPTDVIEVGVIRPEALVTRKPIQPGYSIGHVNVSAGTFGALVTKGKAYAALSNSHVLAASGKGKKGDKILYPGKADGGHNPGDVVGTLTAFKKFKTGGAYVNTIDAAVAKFAKSRLKDVRSDIKNLGVPKGTTTAKLDMQITKTGRTTATTKGKVVGLAARLQINYPGVGLVGFRDQVFCTRYSKPGDSGSLVLEKKTKKAVGLHFAGGAKGSFFNPIGPVLKGTGARLVTKAVKTGTK